MSNNRNTRSGATPPITRLGDESQLANLTYNFRPIDVDSLNIRVEGTASVEDVFEHNATEPAAQALYLKDIDRKTLIALVAEHAYAKDASYTNEEKSLLQYLRSIMVNEEATINTEESRTDSLVNYLLAKLGLNEFPYILRPQAMYRMFVRAKSISSKPEFSIESLGKVYLVDEDKHLNNTGAGARFGEYQVLGELLVSCIGTHNRRIRDYNVTYGMRVVGTQFTFYKCVVPRAYWQELANGLPTQNYVSVHRYPTKAEDTDELGDVSYDYKDAGGRRKIIEALYRMKASLDREQNRSNLRTGTQIPIP